MSDAIRGLLRRINDSWLGNLIFNSSATQQSRRMMDVHGYIGSSQQPDHAWQPTSLGCQENSSAANLSFRGKFGSGNDAGRNKP